MKVLAIATRNPDADPKQLEKLLQPEADHVLRMIRDETVREVYSRTDGKGAVLVLECEDEAHARRLLSELPLAKAGILTVEIYGTKPYRGVVQHVK